MATWTTAQPCFSPRHTANKLQRDMRAAAQYGDGTAPPPAFSYSSLPSLSVSHCANGRLVVRLYSEGFAAALGSAPAVFSDISSLTLYEKMNKKKQRGKKHILPPAVSWIWLFASLIMDLQTCEQAIVFRSTSPMLLPLFLLVHLGYICLCCF